MARVRLSDTRPTKRPPPRRLERRPMRTRPNRPVEESYYEDEAEPQAVPRRARQPAYEEETYDEPQYAYDDEPEEEPVVLRRSVRPRSPMHGPRLRGYREPQHMADHGEPRRKRRRKATAVEDMFYIPVEEIPEGSSYEWKRWTVIGQEDPFYIAQMREQGWEPVLAKRHPTWVPPNYDKPHIIKNGMILMERPIELTEEARAEQKVLARQQVREAEARLGRTPGNTHQRLAPKITKEVMRQVSVED